MTSPSGRRTGPFTAPPLANRWITVAPLVPTALDLTHYSITLSLMPSLSHFLSFPLDRPDGRRIYLSIFGLRLASREGVVRSNGRTSPVQGGYCVPVRRRVNRLVVPSAGRPPHRLRVVLNLSVFHR
jgi:hypothetical protein